VWNWFPTSSASKTHSGGETVVDLPTPKRKSAFTEAGFDDTINRLVLEIIELYLADDIPWVIGYSGGKDSTAVLQLVWLALRALPPENRTKSVHVISTDTLVENPIVAAWVTKSLESMRTHAKRQNVPIEPHRLTPKTADTFWVNLIGRGYPAPRPKFRWCTLRMKITPASEFISNVVKRNGEAILVLGTRKAESSKRHAVMTKFEKKRIRERLSPNGNLPNCLIYSPVEDWSNDDVWMFLMQSENPWGYDNRQLLTMYAGASADGECPLVVDTTTPSCGDSRFGCWVCTLVDQDKSMAAMIQNDEEKEWMLPLLELRNKLDVTNDRPLRDFRRMSGRIDIMADGREIPGPYVQSARENWLRELLKAQRWIRDNAPEAVRDLELITTAELEEIRRIWVLEKHEFEDLAPKIWEETMSEPYPGRALDESLVFGLEESRLLLEACGGSRLRFELARELLDVERRFRSKARRSGLYEAIEGALQRGSFETRDEALTHARALHAARETAQKDAARQLNMPFAGSTAHDPEEGGGDE
jgi:DNA sulfur modification protein DndC